MIRAIFFDFYSVWAPDKFLLYLAAAQQAGPEIAKELSDVMESYYHGAVDLTYVADNFRNKLGRSDVDADQFKLQESDISPEIINFMRNLHGHFVKLGVLANLGAQEYELLKNFNEHNQVFEVIAGPLPLKLDAPLLSQEVFVQALQAIGEPPRSCLLVSGNLSYLEFAVNLGIDVLQFEGLPKLEQSLGQLLSESVP